MKLQLIIPQYNETEDVVKNMLDSIEIQQGISLDDIEVLIGNDGSDIKLSKEFLDSYPFSIKYFEFEHTSPAGTRQRLFDKATADYVMFCDADDMFFSVVGLYTIMHFIKQGVDALVCDFMEEIKDLNSGNISYFTHHKDDRFVHGKVYRRQHILDNGIIWREDIRYHEDSAYNILAIQTAKNVEYFTSSPIYLWKWRDNSVCREDPLYVLKTYTRMIYSHSYLINDLIHKGMEKVAMQQVGTLVYNIYYMLNKDIWLDPMNAKYRYETEKCFKDYFAKYKLLFNTISDKDRKFIISGIKHRVLTEGVLLEKFTFDDWLKHIEALE